jgi:O-antigen/teichoic acid export membrane protein
MAGAVSIMLPKILKNAESGNSTLLTDAINMLRNSIYKITIIISATLSILIHPLVIVLGKESFVQNILSFYVLLLGSVFLSLSYIPHYELFARRKDKSIVVCHLSTAAISIILCLSLIPIFSIIGAAVAYALSMLFLLAVKHWRCSTLQGARL